LPDCVPADEQDLGQNPEYIEAGVPICPSDEPTTGYEYPVPENPLTLPSKPTTSTTSTTTPTPATTSPLPDCVPAD
jgi:hypothetical protein